MDDETKVAFKELEDKMTALENKMTALGIDLFKAFDKVGQKVDDLNHFVALIASSQKLLSDNVDLRLRLHGVP